MKFRITKDGLGSYHAEVCRYVDGTGDDPTEQWTAENYLPRWHDGPGYDTLEDAERQIEYLKKKYAPKTIIKEY